MYGFKHLRYFELKKKWISRWYLLCSLSTKRLFFLFVKNVGDSNEMTITLFHFNRTVELLKTQLLAACLHLSFKHVRLHSIESFGAHARQTFRSFITTWISRTFMDTYTIAFVINDFRNSMKSLPKTIDLVSPNHRITWIMLSFGFLIEAYLKGFSTVNRRIKCDELSSSINKYVY